MNYNRLDDHGSGLSFPATEDGNVILEGLHPAAMENLAKAKANVGTIYSEPKIERLITSQRLCGCGSREIPEIEHDARGIPLGYMCSKCRRNKLSKYRPEVLNDSNYEAFEDIAPEPEIPLR